MKLQTSQLPEYVTNTAVLLLTACSTHFTIRSAYDFSGTPIRIQLRNKKDGE